MVMTSNDTWDYIYILCGENKGNILTMAARQQKVWKAHKKCTSQSVMQASYLR